MQDQIHEDEHEKAYMNIKKLHEYRKSTYT